MIKLKKIIKESKINELNAYGKKVKISNAIYDLITALGSIAYIDGMEKSEKASMKMQWQLVDFLKKTELDSKNLKKNK